MRLVVLQSNYIPWKGYFDLMSAADQFIVYDSVQYTKNDWRNRNRLMTASGPVWLTIPVVTSGRPRQSIRDAQVKDERWAPKHWRTISQALGRRPHFERYAAAWEEWYQTAASLRSLHEVNLLFLTGLRDQLGLRTRIVEDVEFLPLAGDPTARLVELCRRLGAESYVTGPAGLGYLERKQFFDAGVALEVISYDHYPPYSQQGPEFAHGVTVLDLLANVGPDATDHLQQAITPVAA